MRRSWEDARVKVDEEGQCRVCKVKQSREPIEGAHTIGRQFQDHFKKDRTSIMWVNPDSIVPLCRKCHSLQHARQLDILPYLTNEEQANAVLAVGIMRAFKRLTGNTMPRW